MKILSKIAWDKKRHLKYGIAITLALSLPVIFYPNIWVIIIAFVVNAMAGICKEIYDLVSKKGTPEVMDALYTILGGFIVSSIALAILFLINGSEFFSLVF